MFIMFEFDREIISPLFMKMVLNTKIKGKSHVIGSDNYNENLGPMFIIFELDREIISPLFKKIT